MPAYQLPRSDGCLSGPKDLPASLKETSHPNPVGQHNGGGLHKPPKRPKVKSPSLLLWAQKELLSLRVVVTAHTNDCTSRDPSVKLLKFADDTTLIGLIQDGDESAYRQEVKELA